MSKISQSFNVYLLIIDTFTTAGIYLVFNVLCALM